MFAGSRVTEETGKSDVMELFTMRISIRRKWLIYTNRRKHVICLEI